jgi:hypothetical protein
LVPLISTPTPNSCQRIITCSAADPVISHHMCLVKAIGCCPLLHLHWISHCDCHHLADTSRFELCSLSQFRYDVFPAANNQGSRRQHNIIGMFCVVTLCSFNHHHHLDADCAQLLGPAGLLQGREGAPASCSSWGV